jgi:glyoxylase-like metal-dependent hydrolase (beta-lactamase superfamily II)
VKYLILTHFHWDHVLGLCEWNTATIAHTAIKEHMEKYRNMKYDDASLALARSKGIYYDFAISCIKKEIEDREHFTVGKIDAFYNDSMEIDLGGVTCVLRHIESPHTDDTTIVYIPEEKTMFLGDCIYGYTKNGFNYYDDQKLFPMIAAIEQYETDYYLCSHESLCPRDEIVRFWQQLSRSHEVAVTCQSLKEALEKYRSEYQEEPTGDIEFFIKSFGLRE